MKMKKEKEKEKEKEELGECREKVVGEGGMKKEMEGEWKKLEYYKEMAKKSKMRIEMIGEILKTGDGSEMKLKMIDQILKD